MSIFGNLFGGHKKEGVMNMEMSGMQGHEHGGMASMGKVTTTVRDPVCGMDIDPNTAAGKSEYMGKPYYFCAMGCKKEFDANPAKFTGATEEKMTGHHHGGGCCC